MVMVNGDGGYGSFTSFSTDSDPLRQTSMLLSIHSLSDKHSVVGVGVVGDIIIIHSNSKPAAAAGGATGGGPAAVMVLGVGSESELTWCRLKRSTPINQYLTETTGHYGNYHDLSVRPNIVQYLIFQNLGNGLLNGNFSLR